MFLFPPYFDHDALLIMLYTYWMPMDVGRRLAGAVTKNQLPQKL